jgi:hypothetical protein
MIAIETQKQIIKKVEELLSINIVDVQIPKQGMDSVVIFVADSTGKEYAIKYYRKGAVSEEFAYKILEENKVAIPVPKVLGSIDLNERNLLILEKIEFPLLESIAVGDIHRYIPSMVKNMEHIHIIKSGRAGYLSETEQNRSWKEILLSKFNGQDPALNWYEIAGRSGLDSKLVLGSVENIIKKINITQFDESLYSFLHTDFNQRNLFIDPVTDEITGIIDWGEAMFGDPIYDFARIRMFIWHFNLENSALESYDKAVFFTPEQKNLEDLYWLSRVIEYLAYYSEELNDFNVGRIKMHQDFLREYKW